MRHILIALWLLFWSATSVLAQVSIGIGIGLPGVNIGLNFPVYPDLVPVPGYPVYYAPGYSSNYFFYDGMYWIYQNDYWYASSWFNGPWSMVDPYYVPQFVLRIPVRYYRSPPPYFYGWRSDAPPRWGDHYGNAWQQQRRGWDNWDRRSAPAPAPLPIYQRQYSGERYPRQEQQHQLRDQNYRYQPRDAVVRQHYQEQSGQRSAPASQQGAQDVPRSPSPQQRGADDNQRSTPPQAQPQPQPQPQPRSPAVQEQRQPPQPPQGAAPREPQQPPRSSPPVQEQRQQPPPRTGPDNAPQGRGEAQEPRRRPTQQESDREKDRDKTDERGQQRNR